MKDMTPQDMRCWPTHCPTVMEGPWNNEEGYFLVGKIVPDAEIPDAVKAKVGEDEAAIWVPQKLLKGNEALR